MGITLLKIQRLARSVIVPGIIMPRVASASCAPWKAVFNAWTLKTVKGVMDRETTS